MRSLFVMPKTPWPLHGGREINAHYLIREMVRAGHEVHVAVAQRPAPLEVRRWPLCEHVTLHVLETQSAEDETAHQPSWIDRRWMRFFGTPSGLASALVNLAAVVRPDYVEACGLEVLPWLGLLPEGMPRIWLAADEKILFHLSMISRRPGVRAKLASLTEGIRLGLYERTYARRLDAAVTVAPADRWCMRHLAGVRQTWLTPNGVDSDYFAPGSGPVDADTAVFWGRLDFEPNVQSIAWFTREVWTRIAVQRPNARLRVIGRNPSPALVGQLCGIPGVEVMADLADLRPVACRSAVTVLPILSGSGIKNKLLEAAAMARPIIASPKAVNGLKFEGDSPWLLARSADQWHDALARLWDNPGRAALLGARARLWVQKHHDWRTGVTLRESFLSERLGRNLRAQPAETAARRTAA